MAKSASRVVGDRTIYPFPPANSGQMLHTGPDGVGDYRSRLYSDTTYIGIGRKGAEASNDISYLFGPDFVDKPRRKHQRLGEIGCDIRSFIDQLGHSEKESRSSSVAAEDIVQNPVRPIVHGPFRTAVENNAIFHRFQEPWYPDVPNTQLYMGWPVNLNRSHGGGTPKRTMGQTSSRGSRAGNDSVTQSAVFGRETTSVSASPYTSSSDKMK
ncbi:uncharacterized protein LOC142335163 [Convolutriloba macropyga]|uniref:uncharacterized protein LOC142335163 n=1 Tax=Convolutriloba macropyga TaxID=536237 RepID=UPI003F51D12C